MQVFRVAFDSLVVASVVIFYVGKEKLKLPDVVDVWVLGKVVKNLESKKKVM